MKSSLLVFARAPLPGRAKTRLIPALGADGAARLQADLIEDTLLRARAAGPSVLELWGTGDDPDGMLAAAARRHGAELHSQSAGDLGARMQAALARTTRMRRSAIVLGTDAPALSSADITHADRLLENADAVIGPAADGGYVLLGLHCCASALFCNMDWGTETVLGTTRQRIRALGWHHRELDERWDVDRPADLTRVAALDPHWSGYSSAAE